MSSTRCVIRNGSQSATFVANAAGAWRPEWFRQEKRPMLRFKDHEWLNIGGLRVTEGQLLAQTTRSLLVGGRADIGGTPVEWQVCVSAARDGGSGFTVETEFVPLAEPIEVLEGLSTFELPYEYDGSEHSMLMMCQQPVYRFEGNKELSGAGFMQPLWYYGRIGRAHLTYPSASPLMVHRVHMPDGGNERCTMLIGNWDACSVHDMFAQPTRNLSDQPADVPFKDARLKVKPGRRGMKYLVGALNWNCSLHKDPNLLVEAGKGLRQEVTVDFRDALPRGRWDAWLADGWERLCAIHFPKDGRVGAYEVAKSRGASWVAAAQWLGEKCGRKEGHPGFLYPDTGTCVYAPHTRPKWDHGAAFFAGQYAGPLAYLAHAWKNRPLSAAAERVATMFFNDKHHDPKQLWTIGLTPMYTAMLRKAQVQGLNPAQREKLENLVCTRTEVMLNPVGDRRPDPGMLAWEAYANLVAAEVFDRKRHEAAARELLGRINPKLDGEFWNFNCAVIGDLVGAGQSRPFGHAIGVAANVLAYRRFKEAAYLEAATRFANLFLGMHGITWNESPAPDLDTRGWCHGSTGGRDQIAQLPPWETGLALQQLGMLATEGRARPGLMDMLWLFSHTGLAQFPKARTLKRLYRPDMSITYRPIDELATERAYYLSIPYLAYENPWDQTMLAGYQGVEPIILSLYLGGGLVASTDERVLALVPEAATYDLAISKRFTAWLWNPLAAPVETRLRATVAVHRRESWRCSGAVKAVFTPAAAESATFTVPPRALTPVEFRAG